MITATQPPMIVLSLSDALFVQLQPYLAGLDIAATAPQLTMRREVYAALVARRQCPGLRRPLAAERVRAGRLRRAHPPVELTQGADALVGEPVALV